MGSGKKYGLGGKAAKENGSATFAFGTRSLEGSLKNISSLESFAIRSGIEFPLRHLPYAIPIIMLLFSVENWPEIIRFKARTNFQRNLSALEYGNSNAMKNFRRNFSAVGNPAGFTTRTKLRKALAAFGNPIGFTNTTRKNISSLEKGEAQRVVFRHRGNRIELEGNQCLSFALDIFLREAYGGADVRGREVVDVGACLGDSAIFFILNGARRIHALEPYPATYRLLEKNLARNGVLENVSLMNIGLGARRMEVMLPLDDSAKPGNRRIRGSAAGRKVEFMTLSGLAKKIGVKNAVLKMDCEAAEYGILIGSDAKTLRRFRQIVMEYHYGYRDIAEHLQKCGFCVRLLDLPHRPLLMDRANADCVIGTLIATRKKGIA